STSYVSPRPLTARPYTPPLLLPPLLCFSRTAPTALYTLSLHDALPISSPRGSTRATRRDSRSGDTRWGCRSVYPEPQARDQRNRSEEHTSELQSPDHLVCRLLLEKKKH